MFTRKYLHNSILIHKLFAVNPKQVYPILRKILNFKTRPYVQKWFHILHFWILDLIVNIQTSGPWSHTEFQSWTHIVLCSAHWNSRYIFAYHSSTPI